MSFGIELCKFHDHWALRLGNWWWTLPWQVRTPPAEIMESWGVCLDWEGALVHLNWGARYRIVSLPWAWGHCQTSVLLEDGTFVPADTRKVWVFRRVLPYSYTLRSGEVQLRDAVVSVERREWCWRWWPCSAWRWPRKVSTCINVEFTDEVGEQTGTWKGGVLGCTYEMRPGETPEDCLRRMERERRFD